MKNQSRPKIVMSVENVMNTFLKTDGLREQVSQRFYKRSSEFTSCVKLKLLLGVKCNFVRYKRDFSPIKF